MLFLIKRESLGVTSYGVGLVFMPTNFRAEGLRPAGEAGWHEWGAGLLPRFAVCEAEEGKH